jgi:hypothetical protein
MTIKGKDIKPGMITQAGQVKEAEVERGGRKGKIYLMHTNNYDGFWGVDEDMEVLADPDNKSKPFTGDYRDLLKKGLKESTTRTMAWEDVLAEADRLLKELCVKSGNADWDAAEGEWLENSWCYRKLFSTRLNDTAALGKLCNEYSKKLPGVQFYFCDCTDEEPAEIGFAAAKRGLRIRIPNEYLK